MQHAFQTVAGSISDDFPVFEVDEVGYKLSKRGERQRPNQLLRMRGKKDNQAITNLHLANQECDVVTDVDCPQTVLDEILAEVSWS